VVLTDVAGGAAWGPQCGCQNSGSGHVAHGGWAKGVDWKNAQNGEVVRE